MCQVAADFRTGDRWPNIFLVGACPGRDEEIDGRPFAGQAGRNLSGMMASLHVHRPDLFPSGVPDDYAMLNAHPLPRYRQRAGYDGRTQPTENEVLSQQNQLRLTARLHHVEPRIILYLGITAEFMHPIVRANCPAARVFRTGHPSTSAWNTCRNYLGRPRAEKIERWARDRFSPVL